jgi:glutamine amidotransferase
LRIGVIHQGAGNIHSVCRGLKAIECEPIILTDGGDLPGFDRLVLPGVGSFGTGMRVLERQGMIDPIRAHVEAELPFLGICLGAQLIMESSNEFGARDGLGLIPGGVDFIPKAPGIRVPHVGWASVQATRPWDDTWLRDQAPGTHFYFTHSLVCAPKDHADILAHVDYGGNRLVASVQRDNILGVQFHPELSTKRGLSILRNFVDA